MERCPGSPVDDGLDFYPKDPRASTPLPRRNPKDPRASTPLPPPEPEGSARVDATPPAEKRRGGTACAPSLYSTTQSQLNRDRVLRELAPTIPAAAPAAASAAVSTAAPTTVSTAA